MDDQRRGFWMGIVAVSAFALTLPMTRIALPYFDAVFIGFGRGFIAGICAVIILLATRSPLPKRAQVAQLLVVTFGVVLGFPLLTALAMQTVPSAHGGVVLGIMPLATACVATLVTNERPSPWFWAMSLLGAAVVVIYSISSSASCVAPQACTSLDQPIISWGHALLFLSVIAAAFGYAVGGVASKTMPGWRVICWSLVLALPFTTVASVYLQPNTFDTISLSGWAAFLYLCLVSQLFGFFIWYKGLAIGGIARVSQTLLIQPLVTLIAAATLAKEHIDLKTVLFAFAVIGIVWLGRKANINLKASD